MHTPLTGIGALPVLYRASTGQKRPFHTVQAAQAYDAGWQAFPAPTHAECGSPAWMGWADHRDAAAGADAMDDALVWASSHGADIGLHA